MKYIVLCVFFFSNSLLSQEYKFDTKVNYIAYNKFNDLSFFNSKDESFFMYILKDKDSIKARIIDNKNKKTHILKVEEVKTDSIFFLKFIYEKSTIISKPNHEPNNQGMFEIENLESNKNSKKVLLKVYRKPNKKELIIKAEFELIENETNIFHAFRSRFLHPFEFKDDLNINGNYFVKKGKIKSFENNEIEFNLLENKKIDLTISIPNK